MRTIKLISDNRNIIIHSAALVEGVSTDYATTQQILKNELAHGASAKDANVIIGLKHAYEELKQLYQIPLDIEVASRYNYLIGYGGTFIYPGCIRGDGEVYVSEYYPDQVDENTISSIINKAIETFPYNEILQGCSIFANICKAQIFYNGNKRTAQVAANHYFAHNNTGCFIAVPQDAVSEFHNLLYSYYINEISHEQICELIYNSFIQYDN